ncbi:MAG TPA: beta-ketoacyl synthase N-terminal-like domain-containing protein [Longimicrobiaceae bacterium]|nr:beta-ketoacyl synthase N-terminal-like domain-containing protein [Longimicrobiaceae bacterium]
MSDPVGAVAVIGMAGRFPGAADVERFWENLRAGVHSITFFDAKEGETDPVHVRAAGVLEGIDRFDAAFFGFSPRDAEMLDPQQRLFLETAWEALENAGHVPGSEREAVAVYAGSSRSDYLALHLLTRPDVVASTGHFALDLLNEPTFLPSRAAYKLDLRGPALNVQTACSSGLVAVHLACQALAAGECDLAVAGGVKLGFKRGHRYTPGGVMSPDGYCRAFDARAAGTVGGSGIGVVVLRRLADALADGDPVRAVILGSAINNDGAQKVGFTAPSVEGQAEVVEEALAMAGVDPETVGYVEAHGSGTELGDPVEVAALTRAFGDVRRKGYCALGSVKTNVGHLDTAAGVAGFVKVVLALEHGEVPPTLHFTEPNPRIDFAGSPFFVNTELLPWPGDGALPRRAGVSSLGIGGTNVHVVLEEAPPRLPSAPARAWHLLPLSARTPAALEAATDRLAAHLRAHPEQELADVAWTLQTGRKAFAHRRTLVARDGEGAARALEQRAPGQLFDAEAPEGGQPVAFIFPGLGSHYPGMGKGLYESEPLFRETVDRCAGILRPYLGMDLREALYPADDPAPAADVPGGLDLRAMLGRAGRDDEMGLLESTRLAQPALFVTEYALARLWMSWGVRPEAMIGHSLGEYVAATVAGVWSLEDALMLVAERARLIEETPPGGMMGLPFPGEKAAPYLRDGIAIGAHNAGVSVVSGPREAVDALQAEMTASGVSVRRLPARHAYHSPMMAPVAERLAELLRRVRLSPPKIPFASNVTGGWIRPEEATDPGYWTRHLVQTVLFSEGVETIARDGFRLLLEVGPGNAVGGLALQADCWGDTPASLVVALRHRFERHPDDAYLLDAAGRLWAAGASVDWEAVHAHERLRRVALPTYPFERERYWVEPGSAAVPAGRGGEAVERRSGPAAWMYLPVWRRAPLPTRAPAEPAEWLVLADGLGIGGRLAGRLESLGHTVAVAEAGEGFARSGDRGYTVRPGSAEDLAALRDALQGAGVRPRQVIVLWGIDPEGGEGPEAFARAHARGYATVAALAATFAREADGGPFRLLVATEGVRDVAGGEGVRPERATVLGPCLALSQELAHVVCRTVDVRPGAPGDERLVEQLLAEAAADAADTAVALRGPRRWVLGYEAAPPGAGAASFRPGGAYLVSGGMPAGTGVLAEHLAGVGARLAVMVHPSFPVREAWDAVLASPGGGGAAGQTIRGIIAAEARGCAPLLLRADPGDPAAVRGAVAAAVEAFGVLHGVVHAVQGVGADSAPLAEARSAAAGLELARLTRELAALEEATAGLPLDFLLLQNSIFSVFGGSGLAAATAAFVLGDAWAERCVARGRRWTSVSWDRWEEEGSSAALSAGAIPRGDGVRVFETLAALAGEPRVVVSPQDLHARLERFRTPRRAGSAPAEGGRALPQEGLHARPRLANEYLEPTGEAEELLAGIFRELLGIREIGTHDSFFELGGHSLLGLQVLARVRETFQVDLPLRAIFEAPTVAGLAALVDEAILLELGEMSDEEAESALAGLDGALHLAGER